MTMCSERSVRVNAVPAKAGGALTARTPHRPGPALGLRADRAAPILEQTAPATETSMTALEIEGPREIADAGATQHETAHAGATREVRHEYTPTLPALLNQLGVSLLVSTYQAGKVVAVGAHQGELTLSYHNFERA